MTTAYHLQRVVFSYNTRRVLSLDELKIDRGSTVALVGPNGTGKTTLLHLLAFVQNPSEGSINFFGEKFTSEKRIAFRRRVGLLLQQPYLFHSTVIANVAQGLRIRGISRSEAMERADQALISVGLKGFAKRHARSLSGGEAQRVALARALVPEPEVLLLDEPANNLDRAALERTEQVVREMSHNTSKTVIFTTHNVETWSSLTNRVLHMIHGRAVDASLFNLFQGKAGPDGISFDTGRVSIRTGQDINSAALISIAPEQITVFKEKPLGFEDNLFQGRIVSLSEDNECIMMEVRAGELFRARMKPESYEKSGVGFGEEVFIHLPTGAITVVS